MRSIAITSGKGGVGKTSIVANLAYALCEMGKRVMILDADLGLGNVDVLMGLNIRYSLEHVLRGEKRVEEIVVEGPGGVKVIPAASGVEELTALDREQRLVLMDQFNALMEGVDVFFIDTAPGISSNVIFFNLAASEVIVVVSPDPSSLVDAYALVKVLSMRHSKREFHLLVNNVADRQEAERIFERFDAVSSRFLGVTLDYLGYVLNDHHLPRAARSKRMVMEAYPFSKASLCFSRLAKKVCQFPLPLLEGAGTSFFIEAGKGA